MFSVFSKMLQRIVRGMRMNSAIRQKLFSRNSKARMLPEGNHSHECEDCGHIWCHGDHCAGDKIAHLCPKCGEGPYWFKHNLTCGAAETRITDEKLIDLGIRDWAYADCEEDYAG